MTCHRYKNHYAGTQNAPRSRCNTHINIQCARGQTLAAGASIPMPIACRASRMRLFASADSIPSLRHRRHAMPPQNQCHLTTWLHVVSRIASLRQCAQHCRRPIASPAAATPFQPAPGRARAAAALEPPSSGKAPELAPFQTARAMPQLHHVRLLGSTRLHTNGGQVSA